MATGILANEEQSDHHVGAELLLPPHLIPEFLLAFSPVRAGKYRVKGAA